MIRLVKSQKQKLDHIIEIIYFESGELLSRKKILNRAFSDSGTKNVDLAIVSLEQGYLLEA